jgi:hypothetical protein
MYVCMYVAELEHSHSHCMQCKWGKLARICGGKKRILEESSEARWDRDDLLPSLRIPCSSSATRDYDTICICDKDP